MKLAVLFLAFVASAFGYNDVYPVHPGVGAIFKGPNSETIIKGPDGSVITSEQIGGAVATEVKAETVAEKATVVVEQPIAEVAAGELVGIEADHVVVAEPVVSAEPASAIVSAAPAVVSAEPLPAVVPQNAPVVVDAIQTVPVVSDSVSFQANPIVVEDIPIKEATVVDSAKLDGPSGSISTHGQNSVISGPASTTISDGKVTAEVAPLKPLPIVETPVVVAKQVPNLVPLPIQRLQYPIPPPLVAGVKTGLPPLTTIPLYRQEVIKNYK